MTILWGKEPRPMSREEFIALSADFSGVRVDVGTGDARQLYRVAARNPERLYVGIDPVREQMREIAVRLRRKPEKGGLSNLVLAVASVEHMPEELRDTAEEITITFPWGSLLEAVVRPLAAPLENLAAIALPEAKFRFVFTYSGAYEKGEIQRRQLPELDLPYLEGAYRERLTALGFRVEEIEVLEGMDARNLDTRWAKRLSSGRARTFYRIKGKIQKK